MRLFKAVVMAAIMMGSAWMLTGDARISIIAALVPFVLGMVNIQTHFAYMLTAGVFLCAVVFQVLGEDVIVDAKSTVHEFVQNARIVQHKSPSASSQPATPETKN